MAEGSAGGSAGGSAAREAAGEETGSLARSELRTYRLLMSMWTRSALQYRATFAMMLVNGLLVSTFGLVELLAVFANVRTLAGFGVAGMLYLAGTAQTTFALAEIVFHGAGYVARRIRLGTFDGLLIRPVGVLTQVFADQFSPMRFSGVVPAAGMLVAGLVLAPVHWTLLRAAVVPYTLLCGTAIWGALWTLVAAYQIVVTDGEQVMSAVTYGGEFMTSYPLAIYRRGMIALLTLGLPIAFVNWEPSLYLLDQPDPLGLPAAFRFLAPAAAAGMWLAALAAWRRGLRRHRSTGS